MTQRRALCARTQFLKRLAVATTSDVLRGFLIERITRHSRGCPKCARGEGHPQTVLTISYPGGRTTFEGRESLRVTEIRRLQDGDSLA